MNIHINKYIFDNDFLLLWTHKGIVGFHNYRTIHTIIIAILLYMAKN